MSVLALHGTEQGRIRESEKGGTENSGVRGTSMTNQYKRGRRGTFKSAHAEITTSIEHITAYKGTYYSCIQKVRTRNFMDIALDLCAVKINLTCLLKIPVDVAWTLHEM